MTDRTRDRTLRERVGILWGERASTEGRAARMADLRNTIRVPSLRDNGSVDWAGTTVTQTGWGTLHTDYVLTTILSDYFRANQMMFAAGARLSNVVATAHTGPDTDLYYGATAQIIGSQVKSGTKFIALRLEVVTKNVATIGPVSGSNIQIDWWLQSMS